MPSTAEFESVQKAIADGLADNGYAVIEHFLSAEEVHAILDTDEFRHRKFLFRKAGVGKQQEKQVNEGIRGDHIFWLDPAHASQPFVVYFQKIRKLIQYLNQELFLSLKEAEIHLTAYPAGTFYKRHLDQFRKDDHRRISILCYLNDDWKESEGGQLRLFLPEATKDIFPISGRLACFRSDQIEHEVLPATRERLSLTGWILDRPLDIV